MARSKRFQNNYKQLLVGNKHRGIDKKRNPLRGSIPRKGGGGLNIG